MPQQFPFRTPSWPVITLVLFAAVLLAWGGSLANGFVWDDEIVVTGNSNLSVGRLPQLLSGPYIPTSEPGGVSYYRPVVLITLLLDSIVWGRMPGGYHATNLLLHLGVVLLIFAIARRLLPRSAASDAGALAAAALFAVHPVHADAVAYVSGRTDLLATLFMLLALAVHVGATPLRGGGAVAAAALSSLIAMLSKETAFLLPLIIVIHDLSARRPAAADAGPGQRTSAWVSWCVQAAVLGAALGVRAAVLESPFGRTAAPFPEAWRLLTAPASALFYVGALIWPGPSALYETEIPPVLSLLDARLIAGLLTLAALAALAVHIVRRDPDSAGGFAVALVGSLQLVGYPFMASEDYPFPAAERLLYLPAAGLAIAASFPLRRLMEGIPGSAGSARRPLGLLSAGAVSVAFVSWLVCSEIRAADWRSPLTLFEALVRTNPRSGKAHYNLGLAHERAGRLEQAAQAYEEAVRLRPDDVRALNNLAVVYDRVGAEAEAEALYREALERDPALASVRFNLALLLQSRGNLREAIAEYRRVLVQSPKLVEAHVHLGDALSEAGDAASALNAYRDAVRIAPDHGEARARYGAALAAGGLREKGIEEMYEGLRLDPFDERVRTDLGAALTDAGRPEEALALLDDSLARWPDDPRGHYNRGNALRALGRREEAIEAYRSALARRPRYRQALNNLGVTLSELQRNEEAAEVFEALVEAAPGSSQAHRNLALVLRALGREEEARRAIDEAERLDPRPGAPRPSPRQAPDGAGSPAAGGSPPAVSSGRN